MLLKYLRRILSVIAPHSTRLVLIFIYFKPLLLFLCLQHDHDIKCSLLRYIYMCIPIPTLQVHDPRDAPASHFRLSSILLILIPVNHRLGRYGVLQRHNTQTFSELAHSCKWGSPGHMYRLAVARSNIRNGEGKNLLLLSPLKIQHNMIIKIFLTNRTGCNKHKHLGETVSKLSLMCALYLNKYLASVLPDMLYIPAVTTKN